MQGNAPTTYDDRLLLTNIAAAGEATSLIAATEDYGGACEYAQVIGRTIGQPDVVVAQYMMAFTSNVDAMNMATIILAKVCDELGDNYNDEPAPEEGACGKVDECVPGWTREDFLLAVAQGWAVQEGGMLGAWWSSDMRYGPAYVEGVDAVCADWYDLCGLEHMLRPYVSDEQAVEAMREAYQRNESHAIKARDYLRVYGSPCYARFNMGAW